MNDIKYLLNQVKIISDKNAEILDASGGRFNIFSVCGVDHYENTHSKILAEFLRPNGAHGLKAKLLENFVQMFCSDAMKQVFECGKASVILEHTADEGRMDILIEDGKKHAIIIENKIYAVDQKEQLKRYDNSAKGKQYDSYQIFYLSLEGKKASEQSAGDVDYTPISYKKGIIAWLEEGVALAVRLPMVRETMNQYINHLKLLTNQDMDTKNKEEIVEILSKSENLKAAKVVSQNYAEVYNKLAEKYFNPEMKKFAEKKGLEFDSRKSEETHVSFFLYNPRWKGKCQILFTYDLGKGFYSLQNNPENKISNDAKNKIIENLKNFGVVGKENNKHIFYELFDELSIDIWFRDIVNSENFLNDCKKRIENLLKATEEIEF